jgi:DNA polymerase-3 subunit alpha
MEAMAMAGAFDSFENTHRAQFFFRENSEDTIFLEKILKHASNYQQQQNSSQVSLFGEMTEAEVKDPDMPVCDPWTKLEQLKNEKEVTGFYMSGHPLEDFKIEIDNFCNVTISEIKNNPEKYKNKSLVFPGIITAVNHRTSKTGNPFATFVVEDFTDFNQFILFSEDYLKFKHFLLEGSSLLIKARIVPRNNKNRDQLDVRISSMILLSDALEKISKEIKLQIPLNFITDSFVKEISEIAKNNKGSCNLKFVVTDEETHTSIEMPAAKNQIAASSFLKEISGYREITYKIV